MNSEAFEGVSKEGIPMPIRPMLATLGDKPFSDENWLFERKLDGYRVIAIVNGKKAQLLTRNGLNVTNKYQKVTDALERSGIRAVLDGEIVVENKDGIPEFQLLQEYEEFGGKLKYYVFDVLQFENFNLLNIPLIERKKILAKFTFRSPIHIMSYTLAEGKKLFKKAKKEGFEGIIGKHLGSIYMPGERTKDWVKIKSHLREEAIICGYTDPKGSREVLGSLLLGMYDRKNLRYIGNVGTGLNRSKLIELKNILTKIEVKASPFENFHHDIYRKVNWVKPKVVCEVSFAAWTKDKIVRHGVYLGIREDKPAKDVQISQSLLRKKSNKT